MDGHCLCGAITVKVNDDELFAGERRGHFCHCRNCRRVAGGIFGANFAIEQDKVEIIGKENMKEYIDRDTTSGKPMARCFCGKCETFVMPISPGKDETHDRSPIQSVPESAPRKVVIKLGVFPKVPQPEWEAFAGRRQDWEVAMDGCVQYKLLGGPGKELLDTF